MANGVLFVSPHIQDADNLSQILSSLPVRLDHVSDLEGARNQLESKRYPVILTDAELPDGGWGDVLNLARRISPFSQVLVTNKFADARMWADVLSQGAYDMLVQPFTQGEVLRILVNALGRPLTAVAA